MGVGVAKGRKITTNQYVCYVQGGFSLDNNQLIGIIPRGGMLLLLKGSKRRRGETSVQMYVVHKLYSTIIYYYIDSVFTCGIVLLTFTRKIWNQKMIFTACNNTRNLTYSNFEYLNLYEKTNILKIWVRKETCYLVELHLRSCVLNLSTRI